MQKNFYVSTAFKIYITLLLFFMTSFWGMYGWVPIRLYYVDMMYIGIALITCLFVSFQLFYRNSGIKKLIIFKSEVRILFVICMVEIVWSYIRYHQPINVVVKESIYYIIPLCVYLAMNKMIKNINHILYIQRKIVFVSAIMSILSLIAFMLLKININILNLDLSNIPIRYGSYRFGVGGIVIQLGLLISISRIIVNGFKNKYDLLNIIVCSAQIIFINKTRTIILFTSVVILISVVYSKKIKKIIRIMLAIVILILGLISIYTNIYEDVNNVITTDVGIQVRFETIDFYLGEFRKVPILGMGFIGSSKDIPGSELLYGKQGNFYRSDVGIMGYLNQFGIVGIIWMIKYLYKIGKKLHGIESKTLMKSVMEQVSISKIIWLYMIITLPNLSFMDADRTMFIPIIMVFLEGCVNLSDIKENSSTNKI